MAFTDQEKLACVQRELALRKHVYPRLIANGKLKPAAADRELALMLAIVEDYRSRAEPDGENQYVTTRGV
jgi:hypothetical protein